jgi:hypothetical protein
MSEQRFEEGESNPENKQDVEERLPASLATKASVRTALEALTGVDSKGSAMRYYKLSETRRARVNNFGDGLEVSFSTDAFVTGKGEASETARKTISERCRLICQDDELTLIQTDWSGKGEDDPDQELTEAAAKRLLVRLAELDSGASSSH